MGSGSIFPHRPTMRWGDEEGYAGRVLDIPVQACRRAASANPCGLAEACQRGLACSSLKWRIPCFQEKPLSFSRWSTVPQTDTGGRAEYAQALERTQEKELGKLTP